ncbi:Olfactory receptor 8U9 [Oryzias melastigma]|uniref:Olfactory receptor 8U9 n=1 Tax=Oryzias melastigma TaxID=30732 RepID=A0A834L365_ORYME|nr:Olfactory receptor 8U9 [Oryzias melastigma]
MENESVETDILLIEGLNVTPQSSIPAFILLLIIYVFIMLSNISLVVLISVERSLHQPMYLLFCSMGINDAFGASAILPHLLSNLFTPSSERTIHYAACAVQAFCGHLHAAVAHSVLMVMAFDRYVAVCRPLQYSSIMSTRMVVNLSASAWGVSVVIVLTLVSLSVRLSRCRRVVFNPFCDNPCLFKLSCQDITINNLYGLASTAVMLTASLGSVTLTYLKIVVVCLSSQRKTLNSRALQTCATHLTLYVIMMVSGMVIVTLHRFPELSEIRKLSSIMFHVIPPALNPTIYGLQIKAVQQKITAIFTRNHDHM